MNTIITDIIQDRAFELVRNRIAEILASELPTQSNLQSNLNLNASVYIDRFVAFSNSEIPAINVSLSRGDYDNLTQLNQDGNYVYNIDVYTSSLASSSQSADVLAMSKLQKLLGVCQGILSHYKYNTLGFEKPFIEHTEVQNIQVSNPENGKDANSMVMGRLSFLVRVPETSKAFTPNLIQGYDTQVHLALTDNGYIYTGDNIPIPTPVCDPVTITNTNGSYSVVVNSGGSLTIADSVVDLNGSVIKSIPATENLTIQVTNGNSDIIPNVHVSGNNIVIEDVNVRNSDNSFSEVVDLVNGNVLPNIDFTDSDGTTTSIPSAKDVVCTPVTCQSATISNSDGSYTESVVSGGALALPDITFTDSDGTVSQVPSVTDVVAIKTPDSLYNLTKTGRPSVVVGDDGFTKSGRLVDFFTLDFINPFGNTIRFTNDKGGLFNDNSDGSTPDYVVDNATKLGYKKTYGVRRTMNDHCLFAPTLTIGNHSGFRPANLNELVSIQSTTYLFPHELVFGFPASYLILINLYKSPLTCYRFNSNNYMKTYSANTSTPWNAMFVRNHVY